jgi:regulator of protease activity HflC (stomatin/prohibitin superfamily)
MSGNDDSVASHKARLKTLGKFGLNWIGGSELAFVFKGEKFHKMLEGPGYHFLAPGLQRIAHRVNIGKDYINAELREVNTGDGLSVGIDVLLEYVFDPRTMPGRTELDKFKTSKRVPQQSDRRAVLGLLAQRAMQSIAGRFRAEAICRGQVWDDLEHGFFDALDKRIEPFGMRLERLGCAVQRAFPPEMLKWRFEMAAQRAVNIDNLSDYAPYQITQALRSEAIEALKGMQGSSPYLNLNDLTGSEQPAEKPKQIVEGQPSRPSDSEPPKEQTTKRDPKQRRSRLDPD